MMFIQESSLILLIYFQITQYLQKCGIKSGGIKSECK
jgi:hypothetical protein